MIASVYIKDGNIHLYNELGSFSSVGGIAYELGRPLLDFICYEPEQFDESFSIIASTFDNEYAHIVAKQPNFIVELKKIMGDIQKHEIYIYFYNQLFMEFIYAFIDSPQTAIKQLNDKIPGAEDKLRWAWDFYWSVTNNPFPDKERRLYRAAMNVVEVMSENLRNQQRVMIDEIQLLTHFRAVMGVDGNPPMDYLYYLEQFKRQHHGHGFYLESPLRSFYGITKPPEIVQLYEIEKIDDLFRFEFIKMIEYEIFIKKCKNCERFFIPRRRADTEYCEHIFGDTGCKCSEIGAMRRYEMKVAENPIPEVHKKAYRRFNSRTRAKKMTQVEFMRWSDETAKKRDACLADDLPFDEFVAWLEQGRVRKAKSSVNKPDEQN